MPFDIKRLAEQDKLKRSMISFDKREASIDIKSSVYSKVSDRQSRLKVECLLDMLSRRTTVYETSGYTDRGLHLLSISKSTPKIDKMHNNAKKTAIIKQNWIKPRKKAVSSRDTEKSTKMLPAVVSYRRDESSAPLLTASESKMAFVSFDHIAKGNPISDLINHRTKKESSSSSNSRRSSKNIEYSRSSDRSSKQKTTPKPKKIQKIRIQEAVESNNHNYRLLRGVYECRRREALDIAKTKMADLPASKCRVKFNLKPSNSRHSFRVTSIDMGGGRVYHRRIQSEADPVSLKLFTDFISNRDKDESAKNQTPIKGLLNSTSPKSLAKSEAFRPNYIYQGLRIPRLHNDYGLSSREYSTAVCVPFGNRDKDFKLMILGGEGAGGHRGALTLENGTIL